MASTNSFFAFYSSLSPLLKHSLSRLNVFKSRHINIDTYFRKCQSYCEKVNLRNNNLALTRFINKALHYKFSKFKHILYIYGYTGMIVHFSIYTTTLILSLILTLNNNINTYKLEKWMKTLKLQSYMDINALSILNSLYCKIFISWVLTKISEPLRILITISTTPLVQKKILRKDF